MDEILHLINEMSPYLLLGFLIAGIMHTFIPSQFYAHYLSKPNFRSVLNAALLGIPIPLCSCGVIPTAFSLRRDGASKGAVISFLIATPQTGVDSIAATYSLMGLPFAVIRPIAALFTSLFGGMVANRFTDNDSESIESVEEEHCCCHSEEKHEEEHCCCHSEEKHEEEHCCCHHETNDAKSKSFLDKVKATLDYAFVDMMGDIGKWLVVGLIIAALITLYVPNEVMSVFAGNTWLSILLVLVISIPMYVCATGSIPVAVALMAKGLTPGAALVLLMAGPAANMASILVIRQRLGTRALVTYLSSIVIGAIAFGVLIDYALPVEWFSISALTGGCCEDDAAWWQWTSTILLAFLLIYSLVIKPLSQRGKQSHHCCCH